MTADHPKTYIAYRFEEKGGDLKRTVVEWKDPKEGQIVVKVLACGVCARYVSELAHSFVEYFIKKEYIGH